MVRPGHSGLLFVVASFQLQLLNLLIDVVKEIDHTHEQEMLKYVMHVYKKL